MKLCNNCWNTSGSGVFGRRYKEQVRLCYCMIVRLLTLRSLFIFIFPRSGLPVLNHPTVLFWFHAWHLFFYSTRALRKAFAGVTTFQEHMKPVQWFISDEDYGDIPEAFLNSIKSMLCQVEILLNGNKDIWEYLLVFQYY